MTTPPACPPENEGTARGAKFSAETDFSGGSGNRAKGWKRKGTEKKIEHDYTTIFRLEMRVKSSTDTQQMVLETVGGLLEAIKKRDKDAAIVCHHDEDIKAFTKLQLPKDLEDLKEEWLVFDCGNRAFKSNIPAGKSRLIKGCIMVASNMEPDRLAEKSELNLDRLGIVMKQKKLQIMETKHNLHLLMCPNGLYLPALKKIIDEVLKKARAVMMEKDIARYPRYKYDIDLVPQYEVIRDFAANAPWVNRGKDEKITSWQKMMFQLEYDAADEIELHNCCEYARKMGLLKRYLGQFANYVKNPGEDASDGEKSTWGTMIARHGSINLSVGSVGLRGLVDADQRCELELVPLEEGRTRQPIHRTVREIMMGSKIDGVRLWQVVISSESGSWEGYYPNGKGCANHQGKAKSWGSQLAAELKFFMLKRGVTLESTMKLLVASFSSDAVLMAETSTMDRHGNVINRRQRAMQGDIVAVEACPWIDTTAGLCKAEIVQLQGVSEVRKVPVVDHTSMAAFNFEKDDNTVTGFKKKGGEAPSVTATGVEGTSLAENTEFTTGGVYTATVNGEELDKNAQEDQGPTHDWEYDWLDDDTGGDKTWDDMVNDNDSDVEEVHERIKEGWNKLKAAHGKRQDDSRDTALASNGRGSNGSEGMSSMQEIMRQLEEMRERGRVVEEQHKAEVLHLRLELATATNKPGEEVIDDNHAAIDLTEEREKERVPGTRDKPNNEESDPLTRAQQRVAKKPADIRGQVGEAAAGSGRAST